MSQELIQEKIEALQANTSLCFKQTNEIIEIAYKAAINDISNIKSSNDDNNDKSKLKAAFSKVEELELELEKAKQTIKELKAKKNTKNISNESIKEKYWVISGKLDSLNKVFDWIYYDRKDLMTIYSELKDMISQLNDQKENMGIR